ncbi:DUF362 domain-containing protein [Methanolacinia paynteri]|uniref:DUF362 domain-containing protein n=1 Tax=Methanolacinia paynteri TaxID=230356 RepID=UPI00064F112D|nr:DUF362 domain-containing protein [Methanolacinia paynteri]
MELSNKVGFVKILEHNYSGILLKTKECLELIDWKDAIHGKSCFIKINAMSSEVLPGRCSSPWVVEAVLSIIRENFPEIEIYIGDTDLAGSKQLQKAKSIWGFDEIAKKYNATFVNLAEEPVKKINFADGLVIKEIELPIILLEIDTIVNIPVLKTHCLTTITCSLKCLWGLLPRARHQLHPVVNEAIADINQFFSKTTLNILDGTIAIEGNGPKTGTPKICDVIFASKDRVALDRVAAEYMEFNYKEIPHILISEKKGIGSTNCTILGDEFVTNKFIKPTMSEDFVMNVEISLRKIPILREIVFKTPLFKLFAWGGTNYNYYIWYLKHGKKYAYDIVYNSVYKEEFLKLRGRF